MNVSAFFPWSTPESCLWLRVQNTRDLYLWASTIISSRAFTAKVLAGSVNLADVPENEISVLLPLIDATNHRPLAKVEWQAGSESIGLTVMEEVPPGVEISNNYGPRNNEQREAAWSRA